MDLTVDRSKVKSCAHLFDASFSRLLRGRWQGGPGAGLGVILHNGHNIDRGATETKKGYIDQLRDGMSSSIV